MRAIAALLACLAMGLVGCKSPAGPGVATPADMSLGNPTAKVSVAEYASLGCPICAQWNNTDFAAFKAKYIDTGRVHYTLKEMLTGDAPIAAAGFLLARCAGKDRYFQVVDAVWRQEQDLLEQGRGGEELDRLIKIGQSMGMTPQQVNDCIGNDAARLALNKRTTDSGEAAHIDATPTFVINGKICPDCQDPAAMDKAIAAAEAANK